MDTNIKILIVEDEASMVKLIKRLLGKMGFRDLTEANNGQAAIELMEKEKFGLIITDWRMPDLDGLQLFEKMKENPDLKKIPFLMITGEEEQAQIMQALQAGIKNCILKPFYSQTLESKIKEMLG